MWALVFLGLNGVLVPVIAMLPHSLTLGSLSFVAGVTDVDSSSQDALGVNRLGGQAEKNRKLQKK